MLMMMNDLTVNIHGFQQVNRDLEVELRDPVSNAIVQTAKPFLDGTTRLPKVVPGAYEITLKHPNLLSPVLRRHIRVLPTGSTQITVVIDPKQFRNTPIEDIPDANLTPVVQLADSVAASVLPLGTKLPGEAIKADDWNRMASSIGDLAHAVAELTRLVSPLGHNHPELERKFGEVTGNFDSLVTTLSAAMTELQRQIQTERFRKQVETVLGDAAIDISSARGKEFTDLVRDFEQTVSDDPLTFSRKARNLGVQLATKVETLKDERSGDAVFLNSPAVKNLDQSVELMKSTKTTSYAGELELHRKADRTLGAGGLNAIFRR
jgi:hypothetical protein